MIENRTPLLAKDLTLSGESIVAPTQSVSMLSMREIFSTSIDRGDELLRQYYSQYEVAFPDPAERTSFERLRQRMTDPSSPLEIACFLSGDQVVGGRHYKVISAGDTTFAYGEFTWVSPSFRGAKLGSTIREQTETQVRSKGASFFLGDFHDPLLISEDVRETDIKSGITPEGRIQFWSKQGYLQLDCPYIIPPLFGQTEWVDYCKIGVKFLDDSSVCDSFDKAKVLEMFHAYWDTFGVPYRGTAEHSRYLSSFDEISSIRVIPLSEKRSFIQH